MTTRSRSQRGTASLEMLLVVPTVFLLMGLMFVMTQAHLARIRLEHAAQLATMSYGLERGVGKSDAEAQDVALERVRTAMRHPAQLASVTVATSGPMTSPEGQAGSPFADGMAIVEGAADLVMPLSESRQHGTVTVTVEPMLLPGVFSTRQASATVIMDFSPWTFDEWSLLGASLGRIPGGEALSYYLYFFGMVGKAGCLGGSG